MDSSTPTATSQNMSPTADEFFRLKVTVDGEPYNKTNFDRIHEKLLTDRLARDDDKDDLLLVAPETPLLLPILLTMGMIKLLQQDLALTSRENAGRFINNTPVALLEKDKLYPGQYEGTEENPYFGMMHVVRRNDGILHRIKLDEGWRIQPLTVLDTFGKSKSRIVYGQAIEDILKVPRGSLVALQKSKALVVTANREKIISDLKSVEIGGDPFDRIFTVARSDGLDFTFVGHNDLKVSPNILFSNNLSSAADMVRNDPDIRLIFVAGYKAKDYANLDYMNNDKVPRKIWCILTPEQEDILQDLTDKGFDSLIWKRSDFLFEQVSAKTTSTKLNFHNSVIRELAGSKFQKQQVEWPEEVKGAVDRSIASLKDLEKIYGHHAGFVHWLWTARSLVNRLVQLPFGVDDFEKWLVDAGRQAEGIKGTFASLAVRFGEFSQFVTPEAQAKVDSLLKDISDIVTLLGSDSNPKQRFIDEYKASHPESSVRLMTGVPVFDEYLYARSLLGPKDGDRQIKTKNRVLILSPKKKKSAFSTGFLAPYSTVIYLGYDAEMMYFQWYFNTSATGPNSKVDDHLRTVLGMAREADHTFPRPEFKSEAEKQEIEAAVMEEESLQETIQNIIDDAHERPAKIHTSPYDNKTEACKISLLNGLMLYLSPKHKVARVNDEGNGYDMVTFDKLRRGDKLIFVSGNRDLFMDVMNVIKKTESYSSLYQTGEAWREALNKYAEVNKFNATDIAKKLKSIGCSRGVQIIRQWMSGEIICPEDDALQAIRLMTMDERLLYGVDDVSSACKQIRSIHMKTGVEIVRRILNKAIGDDVNETLGMGADIDYHIALCASNARIYTVAAVGETTEAISVKLEGRLQPDETDS